VLKVDKRTVRRLEKCPLPVTSRGRVPGRPSLREALGLPQRDWRSEVARPAGSAPALTRPRRTCGC
jgi:hypothetical protein